MLAFNTTKGGSKWSKRAQQTCKWDSLWRCIIGNAKREGADCLIYGSLVPYSGVPFRSDIALSPRQLTLHSSLSDQRQHRGPNPRDAEAFAPEMLPRLRDACADLCWLLSRGYDRPAWRALKGGGCVQIPAASGLPGGASAYCEDRALVVR